MEMDSEAVYQKTGEKFQSNISGINFRVGSRERCQLRSSLGELALPHRDARVSSTASPFPPLYTESGKHLEGTRTIKHTYIKSCVFYIFYRCQRV